jgi:hypothetical protein
VRQRFVDAVLTPVRAMRWAYLPLLMVYFAYGALGLTAIADQFWVKQALTLTPADLAKLGVWLALPWAMKMVFGELVDAVPILGSQRRIYVFIGAGLIAVGFLLLAGASSKFLTFAPPDHIYIAASLVTVIGVVLQDVVADAMSTEVVDRENPDGSPRDKAEIDRDLGMVQVLGRLALSIGIFVVAGLGGWLAQTFSYTVVFLMGLAVPLISITGALLVRLETTETRPVDWRILGGGLAFGALTTALAFTELPGVQEVVFVISMAVVIAMLTRVTRDLDPTTRKRIALAAIIIFAFRSTPGMGEGYRWFMIDVLKFDEGFFGVLAQIGAATAMAAAWLLSDSITRQPVARILLWLTIVGAVMWLPNFVLVFGWYEWTQQVFGVGARSIALFDSAAQNPLVQVSMIPLLTLVAIYAPAGHRATWFALMASFMNLALVAGQLQTKYLNVIFPVERGEYSNVGMLAVVTFVISVVVPLVPIMIWGRRIR